MTSVIKCTFENKEFQQWIRWIFHMINGGTGKKNEMEWKSIETDGESIE